MYKCSLNEKEALVKFQIPIWVNRKLKYKQHIFSCARESADDASCVYASRCHSLDDRMSVVVILSPRAARHLGELILGF